MTFDDLPIGAKFVLDHPFELPPEHQPEVLRKVSSLGFVDATNPRIHGDCDADYPVKEIQFAPENER